MLRVLWVISLLVVAGAEERDPLESVERYFDALKSDINKSLRNAFDVLYKESSDSSYTSFTRDPTNRCGTSVSSTAYPVSQPTMGTTGDCGADNISAEPPVQGCESRVGSLKGVAGVNFPDYLDIPLTSFSCSDKNFIPGFYADMETGCQVFHVCWPHRRESFLCPVGTTFNQALLACDYWYSSNCSLAPHYYNLNEYSTQSGRLDSQKNVNMGSMIDILLGTGRVEHPTKQSKGSKKDSSINPDSALSFISNFLPVKSKVTVYPETEENRLKIVATASVGKTTKREKYVHKTSESSKKSYLISKTLSPSGSQYSSQSPKSSKTPYASSKTTSPSESLYSTQSSETSAQDYVTLEKNIKVIFDKAFEFVQRFLRDSRRRQKPETSAQDYATIEKNIKVILDKVFEVVQRILREPRGIQKAQAPVHAKDLPLTKLNPRFKTKPIMLPEDKSKMPSSVSSTTGAMGVQSSAKSPVAGIPKMSAQSKTHAHVKQSVSSMTKEALAANYLRLLKIRKA